MRTAALVLLLGLLCLVGTGCSDSSSKEPAAALAPGCDMVPRSRVVGLLGNDIVAKASGTVSGLRDEHSAATCRNTVPGHPERYVVVEADYHPAPMRLPTRSCGAGWVYAGTPEKFTPACQEAVSGHGRTQLLVRWQPYVMHVTIGRSDRNWGGDPEIALAMSRALAQKLGVKEARGDG
jgi:hypothetical protein